MNYFLRDLILNAKLNNNNRITDLIKKDCVTPVQIIDELMDNDYLKRILTEDNVSLENSKYIYLVESMILNERGIYYFPCFFAKILETNNIDLINKVIREKTDLMDEEIFIKLLRMCISMNQSNVKLLLIYAYYYDWSLEKINDIIAPLSDEHLNKVISIICNSFYEIQDSINNGKLEQDKTDKIRKILSLEIPSLVNQNPMIKKLLHTNTANN